MRTGTTSPSFLDISNFNTRGSTLKLFDTDLSLSRIARPVTFVNQKKLWIELRLRLNILTVAVMPTVSVDKARLFEALGQELVESQSVILNIF